MRFGTQALAVIRSSTVPWCSIMVRKAFGMAALTQRNGSRAFLRYAWPSARWGSLPIAGGVDAAYRAVIEAADDPAKKRAEIEARLEAVQSPLRTAEASGRRRDHRPPRNAEIPVPIRQSGSPTTQAHRRIYLPAVRQGRNVYGGVHSPGIRDVDPRHAGRGRGILAAAMRALVAVPPTSRKSA